MRTCRACGSADLGPLPFPVPLHRGAWLRCATCGSDSNNLPYIAEHYTPTLSEIAERDGGGDAKMREQVKYNVDLLEGCRGELPDNTFLDVGCCDGAAMRELGDRGWATHGFDVFMPPWGDTDLVTVGPNLNRWQFPRRYSAVMCREVLEHVDHPQGLLHELHACALPGGIVQVQTPSPLSAWTVEWVYIPGHLCIFSPGMLKRMMTAARLEMLFEYHWDGGQVYVTRALA